MRWFGDRFPIIKMRHPADYLPLFRHLPAVRPPGERFSYCGSGYILLGLIIEQATGLPFAEAIRGEVLEPAGMAESAFFALDEVNPRVATGYIPPTSPGDPWRTNIYSIPAVGGADGGPFVTARDLDRFLHAVDDGTLLTRESHSIVLESQVTDPDGDGYGYGFYILEAGGRRWFGHTGEEPGFSARAWRHRELDLNTVVLANISAAAAPVDLAVEAALWS